MRLLLLKNIPGSPSTSFNEISNTSSIAKSNGNTSPSASISNSTSAFTLTFKASAILRSCSGFCLLYTSTEARAKEVKKMAEKLITLAVKEKDNFETVKVSAKVPKKDAEGKRVKEVVDGKKVTVYETVEKEIKKDLPSRLHARKQMDKVLYTVTEVPTAAAGKKMCIRDSSWKDTCISINS